MSPSKKKRLAMTIAKSDAVPLSHHIYGQLALIGWPQPRLVSLGPLHVTGLLEFRLRVAGKVLSWDSGEVLETDVRTERRGAQAAGIRTS